MIAQPKCVDSLKKSCGDSRPRLSSRAQLDRSPNHEIPYDLAEPSPASPRP